MTIELQHAPILVVGAGIMGAGIAQVAAKAGHAVLLHDARAGAAADAKGKLAKTLDGLVAKGKLGADAAAATLSRIEPIAALDAAASAGLVVEAIVEQLDAKRALLRQLEDIVGADCVLASNTSSISGSAIANGLPHPGRGHAGSVAKRAITWTWSWRTWLPSAATLSLSQAVTARSASDTIAISSKRMARPSASRSMISARPGRRGTRMSHG